MTERGARLPGDGGRDGVDHRSQDAEWTDLCRSGVGGPRRLAVAGTEMFVELDALFAQLEWVGVAGE